MSAVTVCYATHRPETLELTARIMQRNEVIILEEPCHRDFTDVLKGSIDIEEHMLELDTGYPAFTLGQYRLLQRLSKAGKQILQAEPYLEHLLSIQYFLAEDHRPEDIEPNTIAHAVYCAEKEATARLIDYYKKIQSNDFVPILTSMNSFAKADATRFVLRDSLRVNQILKLLVPGKKTFIEAGSIHLLLCRLLAKYLPGEWHLQTHSVDREAVKILKCSGSLFSPGDELTLDYIFGRNVSRRKWQLLCAQSLIYSKIVSKDELSGSNGELPHTVNEIESISAVKNLAIDTCRVLYQKLRPLSTEEAADFVKMNGQKK